MTTETKPRLQAHNNYITVKLETMTDTLLVRSGLLIPRMNGKAVVHGLVTSVGPDTREPIKPGDLALLPPYGVGVRVDWNHEPYLIILDNAILGVWPAETLSQTA